MNGSMIVLIIVLIVIALWVAIQQKWIPLPATQVYASPLPPVPAAYPMYSVYNRYPFGVPWDRRRFGTYGYRGWRR
jgi:hypothetical protein